MKVALGSFTEAAGLCIEFIRAEGREVTMSELRSMMRDKFDDVVRGHADVMNGAGMGLMLRKALRRHRSASGFSAGQIQMAFGITETLTEGLAIPLKLSKPLGAKMWKEIGQCNWSDLVAARAHLRAQIKNDSNKLRGLEELMVASRKTLKNCRLTVSDAVRMNQVSGKK